MFVYTYVPLFLPVGIEAVGVVSDEQIPIVVSKVDIGPINSSLSLPPAVIVYVTPQFSPPIVTVAIKLSTGPVPKMRHCMYVRTYVHNYTLLNYAHTFMH